MPGFLVRHRKFLITLALFLVLFWLVTYQVKAGRLTFMERPVLAVSGLVERVIIAPFRFAESAVEGYVLLVRTHRENERLKLEQERLTLENSIANELLLENERLRDLLGFKKLHPLSSVDGPGHRQGFLPLIPHHHAEQRRRRRTGPGHGRGHGRRAWSARCRWSCPEPPRSSRSPIPAAPSPSGSSATAKKACWKASWTGARSSMSPIMPTFRKATSWSLPGWTASTPRVFPSPPWSR